MLKFPLPFGAPSRGTSLQIRDVLVKFMFEHPEAGDQGDQVLRGWLYLGRSPVKMREGVKRK